jgi:transcriptional regulator with XRE-family HTH domain
MKKENKSHKFLECARRVASNIQFLRKLSGLSQTELADRSGTSVGLIANIEQEAGNPSMSSLVRVAEALGVDVLVLFLAPEHALYQEEMRAAMDRHVNREMKALLKKGGVA